MAYFQYRMIGNNGRPKAGLIDLPFENPLSATTYLEQQGNIVIFVRPLPRVSAGVAGAVIKFFERPITKEELAESLSNVSVMLKAGIPLITALRDAMGDHDNPTLARIGKEIVMRVEGGSTLTNAMASYPRVFPKSMLFLVKLGEESGNLDRTLKDAGEHIKRVDRIIKDTKSAMTYPAFLFLAIFAAMGFWLVMVVPVLKDLFRQQQLPLPDITLAVMAISDFIQEYILLILVGVALFFIALGALIRNNQKARILYHRFMLKMPVIKIIITAFNLAFITEYLSLMLSAGVDIFRSLETMGESMNNEVYSGKLLQVRDRLLQGTGLRDSFESATIFPSFVVRMIGVGEQSGTLSEQLEYVAEDYRFKLELLVSQIGKMVEPIALGLGGGLFLVMIYALFSPVYQLIAKM